MGRNGNGLYRDQRNDILDRYFEGGKPMKNGVFTENFVRIDTDDGVAGVMVLKRRKGDNIDFSDETNQIKIMTKSEAEELIQIIKEGMSRL